MLYCDSKQLSPKTLKSYQKTLTLFINYLKQELKIDDASKVKSSHIRHYIKYLRERGKYTVTATDKSNATVKSLNINYPDRRNGDPKSLETITKHFLEVHNTTIDRYL